MKKLSHNQLVVQEMLRTSSIITHLRMARAEYEHAAMACKVSIVEGKPSEIIHNRLISEINENRYSELYFANRMEKLSKLLEGFDASKMDPIEYISRFDVSKKVVDIVKNTKHVAWLSLVTGEVTIIESPTA